MPEHNINSNLKDVDIPLDTSGSLERQLADLRKVKQSIIDEATEKADKIDETINSFIAIEYKDSEHLIPTPPVLNTLAARQLAQNEIVTQKCKQLIDDNFIGVFSYGIPASEFANPIYIFIDTTGEIA